MMKPVKQQDSMPLVMEVEWAKRVLTSINWSFSTSFSTGSGDIKLFDCRKYHWYPATFIPEIPYTLIEVLSKPGATIYDPFGGIGTTVFQALILGRKPIATEVCRVSINFMRSMWTLLSPDVNLVSIQADINNLLAEYRNDNDYCEQSADSTPALMSRLRPWFSHDTFNQLAYLMICEHESDSPEMKATIRIALSACLKTVCSQDRGWGCIADNMLPKDEQLKTERNAFVRFTRNIRVLVNDIDIIKDQFSEYTKSLLRNTQPESVIVHDDVRLASAVENESADIIVTSPPYPNMTDYATSQRLSYYYLGSDPVDDLRSEIGARRRRFSPNSIQQYKEDMFGALQAMSLKLKPGGYACFVMPTFDDANKNNLLRKHTVQECMAYLLSKGFVLEQELQRILPSRRRHHNQKWTSLEREDIYIYRKLR